jgi:hypothetical protein
MNGSQPRLLTEMTPTVVGQDWLERSTDLEHDSGGTAVFYTNKKLREMIGKGKVEKP